MGMMLQIMQMMMMLLTTFLQGGMGGGMGGGGGMGDSLGGGSGSGSGGDSSGLGQSSASGSGGAPPTDSSGQPLQALAAPKPFPGGHQRATYTNSHGGGGNGDYSQPSPGPSQPGNVSNDTGWNNNVNVFCSSDANHETLENDSSGYLTDLENGMDKGESLTQAHDNVHMDQNPVRNNASNSLVKGKGGNAIIVTGDGYDTNGAHSQALAAALKRDYGMNVQIISDASPNQLKAALQNMGQQKGQQCLVAVLGHGAHDDSGQNNGDIAMGKSDGDQWLKENDLKSMVNQYLAPNYGSVNLVINSCFSGNFVQ